MRTSVRGLTEGAILAALVALLAVAARYIPVLGLAAGFVCPLPLSALVIRHGLRTGILAAFVAAAIGGIIAGPLVGGGILLAFAPLGITLGVGTARGWSAGRIVLVGSIIATVGILANLGVTLAVGGVNPFVVMIDSMRQSQQAVTQFYQGLGIPREQIEQAAGQVRRMIDLMPRLIPLAVLTGGVMAAYLNMVIGRSVLGRFGYRLPQLPPMLTWEVPPLLMWLFVLGFILMAWGGLVSSALETAGINLTLLVQLAFILQGLIVGWILLERYRAAPWLRWVAIFLALTNPLFGLVAFFLGLADSAFFLRERWRVSPT
ncbi:MAG: YybS family protein [bacterium]